MHTAKNSLMIFFVFFVFIFLSADTSLALRSFILSPDQGIYGKMRWIKVEGKDTLLDIARDFGLGYNQIVSANPKIDPWIPAQGSLVLLPDIFIPPRDRLSTGIVVNLAEMRLYYFYSDGFNNYMVTAPVGVGREGFFTKLGIYAIKSRDTSPTWYVPESIRQEDPSLPSKVPPGPKNPLGGYIFRLSRSSYGIHSTNMPWGVGRRVSHGCIRLYPEDIGTLYNLVPKGTLVRVTYEPIKIGYYKGDLWVQVFDDYEDLIVEPIREVMSRIAIFEGSYGPFYINESTLQEALSLKDGIPRKFATSQKRP